jgi:hypothetical protein
VATNNSIAIVSSGSASALNDSIAIEDGALVGGNGLAVGQDNSGAIAFGGGIAINDADNVFNVADLDLAISNSLTTQELSGVSMVAEGGADISSGAGGGGTLTTGGITATISNNTGITTVNMNTGIGNQGAAVAIGAIASF